MHTTHRIIHPKTSVELWLGSPGWRIEGYLFIIELKLQGGCPFLSSTFSHNAFWSFLAWYTYLFDHTQIRSHREDPVSLSVIPSLWVTGKTWFSGCVQSSDGYTAAIINHLRIERCSFLGWFQLDSGKLKSYRRKILYFPSENILGDQRMFSSDLKEWRKYRDLFCCALLFYISEVDFEMSFVVQAKIGRGKKIARVVPLQAFVHLKFPCSNWRTDLGLVLQDPKRRLLFTWWKLYKTKMKKNMQQRPYMALEA